MFAFLGITKKTKSSTISIITNINPTIIPSIISFSLISLIYMIPKNPVMIMIIAGKIKLKYVVLSIKEG